MIILVNHLIYDLIKNFFKEEMVYPLLPYSKLDSPVSSHPDTLLCIIDNVVFCYEEYYYENEDLFKDIINLGYEVVKTKHSCDKKYPKDIGLNALIIGKKIFCNKKFIAKELLEFGEKNGYKIINVKQGYSACSTFVVDEKNAITSDLGMKKALNDEKIKVEIIPNDNIILEGYNCGFIGGSGFVLKNTAYFFGKIKNEKEYECVNNILKELNVDIVSLIDDKLHDYGGIKIIS